MSQRVAPIAAPVAERRACLLGLLTIGLIACSNTRRAEPPALLPPPLKIDKLASLATSAGLVWMIRARPRKIAEIPFLIPAIGRIVPEQNFDAFEQRMGLDARELSEVLLLRYGNALGSADAQIVRHNVDPSEVERRFFARLTKNAHRHADRPDLVRISGVIGQTKHAFARFGADVVVFQQGGERERGPVRIASLNAQGKLHKVKRLVDDGPLERLLARFGDAPLVAAAVGPFTDEWKSAARGLLEIATGIGAAARPTARENIGLALAIEAEFGEESEKAGALLHAGWEDLALSTMGHLLGLDRPIEAALVAADKDVVTLAVEVDPNRLAEGFAALAKRDLETIMRFD